VSDKFESLTVSDNWGRKTYKLEGRNFDQTKPGWAIIKFPDGTVETGSFFPTPRTTRVYDHGHYSTVEYAEPVIKAEVHGYPVIIPLAGLQVKSVSQ